MFCQKCGEENSIESKFCSSCGNSMNNLSVSRANTAESEGNKIFVILGWLFNAISTLFIPILFATGGFIFGYLHSKVNKTHGTIIMIAAVGCGLFGVVLGIASAGY